MYKEKSLITLLVILNMLKAISNFAFIIGLEKIIVNVKIYNVIFICIVLLSQYIIFSLIQYFANVISLKECGNRDLEIQNKIKRIDYSFFEKKDCQDKITVFRTSYEKEIKSINSISDTIYVITNGILFIVFLFVNMNVKIAFIDTFLLLVILFFTCFIENKMSNFMYDYWENYKKNTRLYNSFSDVFLKKDYAEEKKIFDFSSFFLKKFNDEFINATNCNDKMGKKRMSIELLSECCIVIFLCCQFFILTWAAKYGYLSISVFIAIITYLVTIFSAITDGLYALPEIFRMYKLKKDFNIFISDKSIESDTPNYIHNNSKYAIEMENVSFSYDSEDLIIKNLSCKLEKGKKYALVGLNGAGKTTLVKIICGLYKIKLGKMKVNGKVKVLFQDFNRYPYTFEDNILLGSEGKNLNEIENIVGLDNLKLQDGINTKLNTLYMDGVDLSGGQWQKIALSRLLQDDSDIIILDEPTSSLDPLMEEKIFSEYLPLFNQKTVIIISHRLGNIKEVDQILTMDNGTIYEKGTHEELMKKEDSLYRAMYEKQKAIYAQ